MLVILLDVTDSKYFLSSKVTNVHRLILFYSEMVHISTLKVSFAQSVHMHAHTQTNIVTKTNTEESTSV